MPLNPAQGPQLLCMSPPTSQSHPWAVRLFSPADSAAVSTPTCACSQDTRGTRSAAEADVGLGPATYQLRDLGKVTWPLCGWLPHLWVDGKWEHFFELCRLNVAAYLAHNRNQYLLAILIFIKMRPAVSTGSPSCLAWASLPSPPTTVMSAPAPTMLSLFSRIQLMATPPCSSVHGILQARILEWVAISCSRDLPDPWIEPSALNVSCIGRRILYH